MEGKDLGFLLDAAAWQDSLLQSYRSLHITIQSILLALAAGLFVAVISLADVLSFSIALVALLTMWAFQKYTTGKFKRIIIARGEDVNFWHREILLAEQQVEISRRHFTKFKVFQKLHRQDAEYLQNTFLSSKKASAEDISVLVEKGLGHTRLAIDEQLFQRISWIWNLFTIGGVGVVVLRLIVYFQ